MGLSGLQIFKQLPKTNCKDCGYSTCMAFALQLATGKAGLGACPHLSPSVVELLGEIASAPVRRVEIGPADARVVLGEESVLYRHEKRFEHPAALTLLLTDSLGDAEFFTRLNAFAGQRFERVGELLRPRLIALESTNLDWLLRRAADVAERSDAGMVLISEDPRVLVAAAVHLKDRRPLLCGADLKTFDQLAPAAKELDCPLVLRGANLRELEDLGLKALDAGLQQAVLEPVAASPGDLLQAHVYIRRAAVRDKVKALGLPLISFPCRFSVDPLLQTALASAFLAKYSSVVVLDTIDPAHILPLLALTQGLYSDPQKPMMVEAGIYPLCDPGPDSPVLITTNFSLTYYTVMGEIENSKIPVWLLVMDVEGQSVLTAWAAGKFVADTIAQFVKKSGIEDRVSHRRLVIPGYVAGMRADLESELIDWEVVVGVREAADIPRFLRALGRES